MKHVKDRDEISHTTSNPGKPIYGAIVCFFYTSLLVAFGLFLLFSGNVIVSGFSNSMMVNKILACVMMLLFALLPFISGLYYLRKIKDYRAAIKELERE